MIDAKSYFTVSRHWRTSAIRVGWNSDIVGQARIALDICFVGICTPGGNYFYHPVL